MSASWLRTDEDSREEEDNTPRQHDITLADDLPKDNLTGRRLNAECELLLDTGDQEVTRMASTIFDQELAFAVALGWPLGS